MFSLSSSEKEKDYLVFQQNALMPLCNRAHYKVQAKLLSLKHLQQPRIRGWEGSWDKAEQGRAVLPQGSAPGLFWALGAAAPCPTHKAETSDLSPEHVTHGIKQFISQNVETALGLCFPCFPLSPDPASSDAQISGGVLLLIWEQLDLLFNFYFKWHAWKTLQASTPMCTQSSENVAFKGFLCISQFLSGHKF